MNKTLLSLILPSRNKFVIPKLIAFGAYTAVVLGPVLAVGFSTLLKVFSGQIDAAALAIPSQRTAKLLLDSLLLAGGAALLSAILGWLGAVLVWSKTRRLAWVMVFATFSLAAIPPFLHAFTWFEANSILRNLLGLDLILGPFHGWFSCLLVEVIAYMPFALGCAYLGIHSIPSELVEAGRLQVPDLKVLFGVILPLSTSASLAGTGIIFLLCLLDYSVPSLMQVHVFAMEIFAEYYASGSPERAFLVSLPLIAIGVGLVACLIGPLKSLVVQANLDHTNRGQPLSWPTWFDRLLWVTGGIFFLACAALLIALIIKSGGSRQVLGSIQQSGNEALYTLFTTLAAIALSISLAWGVAKALASQGREHRFAWGITLAPLGIPAALVGAGLVFITREPLFQREIFAAFNPAAACIARFTPIMVLALFAQMSRTDPLLSEAAEVYQPSRWRRFWGVQIPLLSPALLLGSAYIFALSLGELAATLMVVAPGRATLSMRIYGYLHYGASDQVAGLCLLLVMSVVTSSLAVMSTLWARNQKMQSKRWVDDRA
jgi:iron(III) transport system permease protein